MSPISLEEIPIKLNLDLEKPVKNQASRPTDDVKIESGCSGPPLVARYGFLWSAPVAFRRVALKTPEWTSRDSNHHRQSVSAGKTNATPTEPWGRFSVGKLNRFATAWVYVARTAGTPK